MTSRVKFKSKTHLICKQCDCLACFCSADLSKVKCISACSDFNNILKWDHSSGYKNEIQRMHFQQQIETAETAAVIRLRLTVLFLNQNSTMSAVRFLAARPFVTTSLCVGAAAASTCIAETRH